MKTITYDESKWKLVPVERITIALESVQNAMEDAYNNAYQECCGRGQGQCCGEPVAAWSDADTAIMDALAPAQRELSALLAAAQSTPATVSGVNQQLLVALEAARKHIGSQPVKTTPLRDGNKIKGYTLDAAANDALQILYMIDAAIAAAREGEKV